MTVLFLGQTAVERSFSINSNFLLPNMETEILCAIKIIHDAIKNLEIKVHEYKVPNAMLKYGSRARAKYYIHKETVKAQIK